MREDIGLYHTAFCLIWLSTGAYCSSPASTACTAIVVTQQFPLFSSLTSRPYRAAPQTAPLAAH